MWHHVNFGHGDQRGHGGRSMKHITNRWQLVALLLSMVFSGCDDSSPVGASPTQEDGGIGSLDAGPLDADLVSTADGSPRMTDSVPGDMGLDVADEGMFVDDSSSPQMEDMGPPPLLRSGILGADDTDQVPVYRDPRSLSQEYATWRTVYVSASTEAAGDGQLNTPFNTLDDAVDALGEEGGIIVLGPGTYRGSFDLQAPLALIGAGVGRTRLEGADGQATLSSRSMGGHLMIGWLTIDGPGVPLVAENLSRFTGFNIALKGGSTGAARIHGVNTPVWLQGDADGDVDTPTDSASSTHRAVDWPSLSRVFEITQGPA